MHSGTPLRPTKIARSMDPISHPKSRPKRRSFLAWPAWQRVLAVLPVVGLLWLSVLWARMVSLPW